MLFIALTGCGTSKESQNKIVYEKQIIENPSKSSNSQKANALEKEAKKWLGTKYKFGGQSRKGVDCSGFVLEVYRSTFGLMLPRNSAQQFRFCKEIKKKELKKGDLVFFSINSSLINHVGIYLDNNKFIHASRKGVVISSLDEKYYIKHYQAAGRVMQVMGKEKTHKVQKDNNKQKQGNPKQKLEISLDDIIEQKLDSIYSTDN